MRRSETSLFAVIFGFSPLRSAIVTVIFIVITSCGGNNNRAVLSKWRTDKTLPGNLEITYPLPGTLFPPEITPPTVVWRDESPLVDRWLVAVDDGEEDLSAVFTSTREWRPDSALWERMKHRGLQGELLISVLGLSGKGISSGGQTDIRTSPDSVDAPIFYRAVPLPFSYALQNLDSIRWHLGDITSCGAPRTMLAQLPLCGNCHSFTPDGRTMAMDIDYANDKGSYVISAIEPETVLRSDKIITWSDFRRDDGEKTFGLLSQISPDGRYVASTVKDRSIFVAKDDIYYSQLFFPIKGIIVIYDRLKARYFALKGADNPAFVQSNPTWSPDGKTIYFARAPVFHHPEAERSSDVVLPVYMASSFIDGEREFKYDIYRVPFNDGRGGTAEPVPGASANGMSNFFPRFSPDGKWVVFTRAENFMLLQPDSRLFIMPAAGGQARELTCNTKFMNSWHSWSPNGKWLVFASKLRGPYADLLLTHIDDNGRDTPPVLLDMLSISERSINIPEFVNIDSRRWLRIVDDFSNQSRYYFTIGRNKMGEKKYEEAIEAFDTALRMDSTNAEVLVFKGHTEFFMEDYAGAIHSYEKAIDLDARNPDVYINMGTALYKSGRYGEAIQTYDRAIQLEPQNARTYFARALCRGKSGDLAGAIRDFDRTIELDSLFKNVYYERGLCRALVGDYGRAVLDFEKASRQDEKNVNVYIKMGDCRYKLNEYSAALRAYDRAAALDPGVKEIYSARGLCKAALNDFTGAVEEYDRAIAIAPRSGVDYCQRGLLRIKLGQKGAGCEDLSRAREFGFRPAETEINRHCLR